ncbi:MAG TPA: TadE/TadG family type IV pilus assembly protein [Gemmataceae bacterium]|nr:TadE/TadG family type IV pilus assembly protein [Gemmataceae bacterium]
MHYRACCPRRRAAALVELALLLPLLIFLFLLTVDFARVFYYWLTIENCARNGATYASLQAVDQDWQINSSLVQNTQQAAIADGANLNPPLTTSDVSVTNTTDSDGNSVVQVTVNYTFYTIAHTWGLPGSISLSRTAQMRIAP